MNAVSHLIDNKSLHKLLLLVLLRVVLGLSGCETHEAGPVSPFLGRFKVDRGPDDAYYMTVSRGATGANVLIYNFVDFFKAYFPATVSGNTLIIPKQVFKNEQGADVIVKGRGVLKSDTLVISYDVTGCMYTVLGIRVMNRE